MLGPWLSNIAWGACGPTPADALEGALDTAEQAIVDLDDDAFRDRFNELAGLRFPCASTLVPADLAVRYHRLMALNLYRLGDGDEAASSIVAAHRLAPDDPVPAELLAEDHPLRAALAEDRGRREVRRVPEPRSGSLAFDGVPSRDRPQSVPTILQIVDSSGLVVTTRYLGAREPLPPYPAVPRRRTALAIGATVTAAASAGMFGLAASARDRLYGEVSDLSVPPGVLDGYRTQANVWTALGGVGLGVATGVGIGAVAVGER